MPDPVKILASRRFGTLSPLRYPGGKAALAGLFADLIGALDLRSPCYVEPYAGGAGAGVALLRQGIVDRLVVNDFDPAVHAFWHSITRQPERFAEKVMEVPLTIEEWLKQREIYRHGSPNNTFKLGFAFFYLNRTNRSGVLSGGVIGGLAQGGTYKIDARFNRKTLADRITAIGRLSDQIEVSNLDGRTVIEKYSSNPEVFMYIDPPYVKAGSRLYLNAFDSRDHGSLAEVVNRIGDAHWLMTYDTAPLIEKLYVNQFQCRYELNYSARHPGLADELMITSEELGQLITARAAA